MIIEKEKTIEELSKKIGFLFSYLFFTTGLYFILRFLNKIPPSFSYLYMMGVSFLIVLAGTIIKKLLK